MKSNTGFQRVASVLVHFDMRQRCIARPNKTLGQAPAFTKRSMRFSVCTFPIYKLLHRKITIFSDIINI